MNAPLVDPALAQSSLAERQLESMRRQAESFGASGDAAREKKLRKACEGFEAVFIQKMWESMRASLPRDGLMHSREEQFWQGMYDQELGKSMASAGGIGLADMMMSQLSRNLRSASQVAVGRRSRTPLEIAPVPLLPSAAPKAGTERSAGAVAGTSLYEGEAARTAAVPEKIVPPEVPVAEAAVEPDKAATGPVAGALQEFAANSTGPDAAGNVAASGNPFSSVHVYRNGQRPEQSLDELAASLAAQAAGRNGGAVRVTTTRQVTGSNESADAGRTRSMRRQAALRRSAAAGRMAEAANARPVVEPAAMPQALQPGQKAQDVRNGPSPLTVSVDGVGSGQQGDLDQNLQEI